MTEQNDPKPPQPPPLDYASPESQPTMPYPAQVALGFVAFFGFVVLVLFATAAMNAIGIPLGRLMPLALLAGFVWLIVSLHVRKRWTGFTAGVLLGLGLSILAFGICFVVVMRSFG